MGEHVGVGAADDAGRRGLAAGIPPLRSRRKVISLSEHRRRLTAPVAGAVGRGTWPGVRHPVWAGAAQRSGGWFGVPLARRAWAGSR